MCVKKLTQHWAFLRRNLRNAPETCRKTTYVTLVRSIMEYGATIWNPYLKGDIDKLERIQNRAIRFVKKDYKSRETGAITRMREDLELETLEDRRLSLRLILISKVVEGLVPALPTDNFVKLARPKRNIKAKHFKDHRVTYVVFRHVSGTFLKFPLRKPSVALAFLHTLLMWMLHFRSFEIWSPKYGLSCTNPYLKGDIDKLERIQNRAIRFVKKDYKSRETGAITTHIVDVDAPFQVV
jgi:hypothetical protein